MNFGQNKSLHNAHFNFHRKQTIFFYKKGVIEDDGNTNFENTDEEEPTYLIQQ